MFHGWMKKAITHLSEVTLAIFLVVFFFSIFLGLLNAVFPTGGSLRQLVAGGTLLPSRTVKDRMEHRVLLAAGDVDLQGERGVPITAVLTEKRHEVKGKRATEIAWRPVRVGMPLYDRDAIQSFKGASAEIRFDDDNSMEIGENTLIIIKRIEKDPLQRVKRSFMVMVDGELRGRIQGSSEESIDIQLALPTGIARIRSAEPSEEAAEFKVTIDSDSSSTLSVYKGTAELATGEEIFRIEANQGITARPDGIADGPQLLPDAPELQTPVSGEVFSYQKIPPRVRFAWATHPPLDTYRVIIARDPAFEKIIFDSRLEQRHLIHGNLKEGTYYWRASAFRGVLESDFSETRSFRIIRDEQAPSLRVEFPSGTTHQDRVRLVGAADPGASVFVGNDRVKIHEDGKFEHEVRLQPGINVIVVEAWDQVGNVVYESRRVNRKY